MIIFDYAFKDADDFYKFCIAQTFFHLADEYLLDVKESFIKNKPNPNAIITADIPITDSNDESLTAEEFIETMPANMIINLYVHGRLINAYKVPSNSFRNPGDASSLGVQIAIDSWEANPKVGRGEK